LRLGTTVEEKKINLNNAMMQITYWGENIRTEDNLHEYAYKEWSGMMSSFYLPRWEIYFNYLRGNLQGKQTPAPDFFAWERKWVEDNQPIVREKKHRPLQGVVNQIMAL
jgi:alpha-N-acetylglucosaminidase